MNTRTTIDRRRFLGVSTAGLAAATIAIGRPQGAGAASRAAARAGRISLGSDLSVARMGYGAMRLTGDGIWGEPADARTCRTVLRRALELGVDFIDTADSYGPFVSERLIAEALHPYPRHLVIATKGGLLRPGANRWVPDCRPEHLREACEGSLKRLKVERIDLYQLHVPDSKVPYEDSIGELARLRKEGKIRHIGVSNVNIEQLAKARAIVPVVSVQNRYNVADRGSDAVLEICERDGIAFIPWAPLGKSGRDSTADTGAKAALEQLASDRAISLPQAQLAWLLSRSPVMLPIPGTSSLEHLEQNVAAAKLRLTVAEMRRVG
ncbi:MAG: aldo/keto reductase [Steroidobacteraceae bacterium]